MPDEDFPDPRLYTKISWTTTISKAKQIVAPYSKKPKNVSIVKLDKSDLWFQDLFPARHPSDLPLRELRWTDIYILYKRKHKTTQLLQLLNLFTGFDYIHTLNQLLAVYFNADILDILSQWCDITLDEWITCAKHLNNYLKVHETDYDSDRIVEIGALTGYRFLDDWDVDAEARDLAKPNNTTFNFPPGTDFRHWSSVLDTSPKYLPKYIGFQDYVTQLVMTTDEYMSSWGTAGSAAEIKFHVNILDDKIKLRARKNMLAYIADLKTIAAKAEAEVQQISKTVVKNELGKVRLAVSSDLSTYLKQSWITYLTGSFYENWPYATAAESLDAERKRLEQVMTLLSYQYALPWDFAGFDHQPTQDQLITVANIFINKAYSIHQQEEIKTIGSNIITGFQNSILLSPDHTYKVTDGLMSGLRWTSLFGNAWNVIMTNMIVQILAQVTGLVPSHIDIRGDDTSIVAPNYHYLVMFRRLYEHIGCKGGIGKFSIRYENTEFLRQHIYTDHIAGYLMRVIPGLLQRKPWNSSPWTPTNSLSRMKSSLDIISRRNDSDESWTWKQLSGLWCQRHKVKRAVLSTPLSEGGLGLEPVEDKPVFQSIQYSQRPKVNTTITDYVPKAWLHKAEQLQIPLNLEQAHTLSMEGFNNILAADDIPQLSREYRDHLTQKLGNPHDVHIPDFFRTWYQTSLDVSRASLISPSYMKYSHLANDIKSASMLCRVSGSRFHDWLRQHHPDVDLDIRRSGLGLTKGISWFVEGLSIPIFSINPKMSTECAAIVVNALSVLPWKYRTNQYAYIFSSLHWQKWFKSDLHRRMFMN